MTTTTDELIEGCGVLWSEVEKDLCAALKTSASFGAAKSARRIGEGTGFISTIAVVTPDWKGAIDDEKLPKDLVLKITHRSGMGGRIAPMHNVEVAFYEMFSLHVDSLKELPIPRMYYGTRFEEGKEIAVLALEHVEGAPYRDAEDVSVDFLKQVARSLGRVHGLMFVHGVKDLPELQGLDLYGQFYGRITPELYADRLKTNTLLIDDSEEMKELLERVLALVPEYFGSNLEATVHEQLRLPSVLAHGDVWCGNLLAQDGVLKGIIDWQCAHLGSCAGDLLRLLLSWVPPTQRRQHLESLLDEQFTGLFESMKDYGDKELPYTREQLGHIVAVLFPHAALHFLPFTQFAWVDFIVDNGQYEEELARRRAWTSEMVKGILEDTLKYHAENQTSKDGLVWKL